MIVSSGGKLAAVERQFSEADAGFPGIDPDEALWRELGTGSARDLPTITHKRAQDVAFTLYRGNPLGHRITELNRDYIVGDGVQWSARNPLVEDIWGEFWTDETNDLEQNQHEFALWLGLYGEWLMELFPAKVSGAVQIGYVDPAQIKRIETVAENPLVNETAWIRRKGYGLKGEPLALARTRDDGVYSGDALYFKVNGSNGTRGWPDMLHIADWLDAYDQMLWSVVERSLLLKAFIWDVSLQGANQQTVDAWMRRHGNAPKTGSVRAHNASEEWSAVSPTTGSYEAAREAQVLMEHVAGGAGLPKFFLSAAEDVNRATAVEMGAPTVKRLARRQAYFIGCMKKLARYVMMEAQKAGRLTGIGDDGKLLMYDEMGNPSKDSKNRQYPWDLIQFHPPEISVKDTEGAGDTLQKVATALAVAEGQGWFGNEVSRQVMASVLGQLGVEFDPKDVPDDAAANANEQNPETAVEPKSKEPLKEKVAALAG